MLLPSKDAWRRTCRFAVLLMSLASVGCQGSNDSPTAPGGPPLPGSGGSSGSAGGGGSTQAGGAESAACQALPSRRIRRLARREYANVVSDLLGAAAGDAVRAALPAEPRVRGFDNQDAFLFVSGPFQEAVADLAAALAAKAD